ncbi:MULTISPECIES: hypothetical protein [unclassified Rhodococcus (in: high G+C Gram-positive bacteria)]|uniref:hypothetical protein n=1 Tax=unclassified Rhodococcus (in: high G+C Gram-positive bacteria) TaxID=192944 RepID=UPI0015C6F4EF|nr:MULTISPECIES: hypothetical protein [unclassified Rhodococcus (in: high G+C Gram-positive bacteria)]
MTLTPTVDGHLCMSQRRGQPSMDSGRKDSLVQPTDAAANHVTRTRISLTIDHGEARLINIVAHAWKGPRTTPPASCSPPTPATSPDGPNRAADGQIVRHSGPDEFGALAGKLLVGNFAGAGHLAFDDATGEFVDYLRDDAGEPLAVEGLWGLLFGNGESLGDADALYSPLAPGRKGRPVRRAARSELSPWARPVIWRAARAPTVRC